MDAVVEAAVAGNARLVRRLRRELAGIRADEVRRVEEEAAVVREEAAAVREEVVGVFEISNN